MNRKPHCAPDQPTAGDPFDIAKLRIDPAKFSAPHIPAKIRKRSDQFVILPMWWYERLKDPVATGVTCLVAWHLLHLEEPRQAIHVA
jgi:hypothetical protein